jgi:hypothetical protein
MAQLLRGGEQRPLLPAALLPHGAEGPARGRGVPETGENDVFTPIYAIKFIL